MANIVICADGTWNRPEEDIEEDFPTNVLKIARAIAPTGEFGKQHVFYDWGLGSYHHTLISGATGVGIHKNILDGYRYIVQNYEEGNQIYLFGFSRGAYTVRSLSGLINNCGILKRAHANLISQAWEVYKSPRDEHHPDGNAAKAFRERYAQASNQVHFVGVWETVGALGIPFSFMGLFEEHDEFYDTKMGSNVSIARHAMAIDEQREDFEPTIWTPRVGVDLKQVWFAGVHADLGGSYPPDTETGVLTSDTALGWMLKQASQAGLSLEPHISDSLSNGVKGTLHKSRTGVFRLKKPLSRPLFIPGKPTLIHPSVRERYESDQNYRPEKLEQQVREFGWEAVETGE